MKQGWEVDIMLCDLETSLAVNAISREAHERENDELEFSLSCVCLVAWISPFSMDLYVRVKKMDLIVELLGVCVPEDGSVYIVKFDLKHHNKIKFDINK